MHLRRAIDRFRYFSDFGVLLQVAICGNFAEGHRDVLDAPHSDWYVAVVLRAGGESAPAFAGEFISLPLSGRRKGMAPMPMRNMKPPTTLIRKVGILNRLRRSTGSGVRRAWKT